MKTIEQAAIEKGLSIMWPGVRFVVHINRLSQVNIIWFGGPLKSELEAHVVGARLSRMSLN